MTSTMNPHVRPTTSKVQGGENLKEAWDYRIFRWKIARAWNMVVPTVGVLKAIAPTS